MKFLKRYHLKNFNFILVTFVTALSIIGIMAVGSAQKSMQGKQIFGVILGLLVMLLFSVIDYKWISAVLLDFVCCQSDSTSACSFFWSRGKQRSQVA